MNIHLPHKIELEPVSIFKLFPFMHRELNKRENYQKKYSSEFTEKRTNKNNAL